MKLLLVSSRLLLLLAGSFFYSPAFACVLGDFTVTSSRISYRGASVISGINQPSRAEITCGKDEIVLTYQDKSQLRLSLHSTTALRLRGDSISFNEQPKYGLWATPINQKLDNLGVSETELLPLSNNPPLMWTGLRAPVVYKPGSFGLYFKTAARSRFSYGGERFSAQFFEPEVDMFLFLGESWPKLFAKFKEISSSTSVSPPLWAYGAFWWRNDPHNSLDVGATNAQENILQDAIRLRELGIRASGIWIDRPFMKNDWGWGDRTFSAQFPDPRGLVSSLKSEGLVPLIWVANRFQGELLREARKNKTLVDSSALPMKEPALDILSPKGRVIFKDYLKIFTDLGFQGFKIDRGDEGEYPRNDTHRYSLATIETASEVLHEAFGADHLIVARSLYDSARRLSVGWSGDPVSDFNGLRASLVAMLRAGIIGFPIIGSDTGGFVGKSDQELFLRWFALNSYSPLLEVLIDAGGKTVWEMLNRSGVESVRRLSEEHHLLIPYRRRLVEEYQRTGIPLVRPLFIEFSEDKDAAGIIDQYMLGEALLVAPVLRRGEASRRVYLPHGKWTEWRFEEEISTKIHLGGSWVHVQVPVGSIAVFQREGTSVEYGDVLRGNAKSWKSWEKKRQFRVR